MKPIRIRGNRGKKDRTLLRNMRYGRTYVIAFAGITESIEFTLQKRQFITCLWSDGRVSQETLGWIREMARNPDLIHFMFERKLS